MELAGALIGCVTSALKIVQEFMGIHEGYPFYNLYSRNFWDYYSFSVVCNLDCPLKNTGRYVDERIIPRILRNTSLTEDQHTEIYNVLDDYYFMGTWTSGDGDVSITAANYQAACDCLTLYVYYLKPGSCDYGEIVTISNMYLCVSKCLLNLPQDWVLINTICSSFLKGKQSFQIQYQGTDIRYAEKIMNTLALAFAPIALGLVRVPEGYLEYLKELVDKARENPSELPGFNQEAQQLSDADYAAMVERQNKRDAVTTDALKELGECVASLSINN